DFSSVFDVADDSGMGGIIAGLKGTGGGSAANGGIMTVTAGRIAAMIAGKPTNDSITTANAVSKISAIHADVIGADTGLVASPRAFETTAGVGSFDWTENNTPGNTTFDLATVPGLSTNDTPIDGFVLVQTAGITATSFKSTDGLTAVTPLKLIKV